MPRPSSTTLKAAASKRSASAQSAAAAGNSTLSPTDTLRKKPSAGILTTSTTAAGKRTARITTTATACPAAATATATATANTPLGSRHPLRPRDQNATPALRIVNPGPETAKSPPLTAARMPSYERPSVAGPRQPTVGRAVNKPPLTPKIAARANAPQQQAPTLATPLSRRPTAESTLSVNGNSSRDRDELTSPVSAFLSSNVTPRSGSRQNRVDSANSTPNGTPNPDRQDPWETRSGLGHPGTTEDAHRKPVVTFSPPSEVGSGTQQDRDSKFFYASDAQKPTPQPTTTRPSALQQPKPSTFFYANGNTLPERQSGLPRPFSPPLASPPQESLSSKFIYANGTPGLQPPAKIGPSAKTASGSVVSTASRLPASRQGNAPRALSPVKSPQQATCRIGNSAVTSPRSPVSAVNPQASEQLSQGKANVEPLSRPTSQIHTKSSATNEPPVTTKRLSTHSSRPSSGSTSPLLAPHPGLTLPGSPATTGFTSLLQAAEDFAEADEEQPQSLNSPTKSSQDGQVTELVANARRERKVQDLEITNASLEAINRTLERQLRKQTAELRRYQRLSRAGRLSMGSIGSRIPSDSTVDGGGLARAGMGLDDLSEEESEIEAEDAELEDLEELDEEGDISSSEASGQMSPGATELRHEKRRRDERRLELDLSKHQQLLIDSQKINQSLKRCLGWTEELIKEGKRALEYQVRVSDVELGGRVLAPEELERRERGDEEAEDTTLGEDTIYAIDALGRGSLPDADTITTWSTDPQDRDSGIELAADGGPEKQQPES
ncbi:hypothetical protein C8A01DRAFT_17154 [Parachaetomium inaequale]|uniref:Uncharacterized protein n=1 Tax=Parachaetomium inaequale TaxID=2588326 RepID=A0AAN6SQR8_9PEZI|nr:hypothetical protein C8A01DRAFT_17154 [Parachaetomium inaequale]